MASRRGIVGGGGGGGGVSFSSGGTTVNVIPKEDGSGGLKDSAVTEDGTNVISTKGYLAPAGTSSLPPYSFSAAPANGMFMSSNQIALIGSNGAQGWIQVAANAGGVSIQPTAPFGWSSSATVFSATTPDTALTRDGSAGIMALKQSATTDALFRLYGASGGFWEHYSATELLTLSTGGTTTNTAANLLPANSIIHAVCCRVTTTIATATNWSVGDSTTAARFSASNATLTSGTTSVGIDHMSGAVTTLAAGPSQAAAATVRITTTGTPSAGVIRITVFASRFVAPTS